jgi:Flp pilus assembly protein TadG
MSFSFSSRTASTSRDKQRGVATIEFALVFTLLFLALYGIATFGAVIYTKQVISRAAEDGARATALLTSPLDTLQIKKAVVDSLTKSLVAPSSASSDVRAWIESNVTIIPCGSGAGTSACVITVTYPYSANRILPSMLLLDTSRWMPDQLTSSATVALAPS